MRIGEMWEGYESICDNGEWTEFETERGETIVQYQCSFNPDYYLGKFLSSLKVRNPEDLAAKASEITMGYDVKLIAQYPLAADGESFEVGYAGVSVGGKEMGNESQYIYEQVSEGAYMPLLLEVYAKEEQNKLNAAVRFTLNSNPELYTSDSDLVEINFEQDMGVTKKVTPDFMFQKR